MAHCGGPRWEATVSYRSEIGRVDVPHLLDELEELHDLVERGPDWAAIEEIKIVYRGERRTTVEQAERE